MSNIERDPKQVKFNYVTSNAYRTIYVNGAVGAFTPRGFIKFDLFTDFSPNPETDTHPIKSDGSLGTKLSDHASQSPVVLTREVQIGVIISIQDAKSLVNWLSAKIEEIEGAIKKGSQDV